MYMFFDFFVVINHYNHYRSWKHIILYDNIKNQIFREKIDKKLSGGNRPILEY